MTTVQAQKQAFTLHVYYILDTNICTHMGEKYEQYEQATKCFN